MNDHVTAPSGVVTFLFTDVEGSTRRWEADSEVMRAALADHDDVLRTAIEAHGGWLFKHTGDGVCAVFTSSRAAHLREVLGNDVYESFARAGAAMTTAAVVTYAFDQIDQARAELNAVSE